MTIQSTKLAGESETLLVRGKTRFEGNLEIVNHWVCMGATSEYVACCKSRAGSAPLIPTGARAGCAPS